MPLLLKRLPFAVLFACTASSLLHAQAVPTTSAPTPYTGFSLPTIGGSLRYSLTASETVVTGYNGVSGRDANAYTNFSGNLAYLSHSQHHPFSAVYSGGYLVGTSEFPSYVFQSLSVSQVLQARKWNFVLADAVDYAPQTPFSNLSGVPGTGDVGVQVGTQSGLGILTTYASRVTNTASGTASYLLTGKTSVSASGSYLVQRYTGRAGGIGNDAKTVSGTVTHQVNSRTSFGGSYSFTDAGFSYPLLGAASESYRLHTVAGFFSRQLTHKVSLRLNGGPQWVVPGSGGAVQSTSLSSVAGASLNYGGQVYNLGVSYSRGVNNGNGVVVGSRYDVASFNAQRQFMRIFQASGLVGYNRSTQLENSLLANYNSSGVIASVQLSAQVARPISVFTSYGLQRQLFNGVAPSGIALNGLSQYFSFGVTYSPRVLLR